MPTYTLIQNGDTGLSVRTTLNSLINDYNVGALNGTSGTSGTSGSSGTAGTSGNSGSSLDSFEGFITATASTDLLNDGGNWTGPTYSGPTASGQQGQLYYDSSDLLYLAVNTDEWVRWRLTPTGFTGTFSVAEGIVSVSNGIITGIA